jgi:hypothetical protein
MIRVYTDFNARDRDGSCWILMFDGQDLAPQVERLGLTKGDRITLYQDDDDFQVAATLDFRTVESLGQKTWVALPDMSTLKRLQEILPAAISVDTTWLPIAL